MDLIASNDAFLILFVFGAIAVAAHGSTMYRVRVPGADNYGILPILRDQPASQLTTRKMFRIGQTFYIAMTELLYVLLSTSTVMLEAAVSAVGDKGSIGALTMSGSDINPYMPIVASSIIITISEIKPFVYIEQTIRRIAHFVAGVPAKVDDVAGALLNDKLIKDAGIKMPAIEFLQLWTLGAEGRRLWLDGTNSVMSKLKSDTSMLYQNYRQQSEQSSVSNKSAALTSDSQTGEHTLKTHLACLLALNLNSQPDAIHRIQDAEVAKLFKKVSGSRQRKINVSATASATAIGALFCLVALFFYHLTISASFDMASTKYDWFVPSNTYLQSLKPIGSGLVNNEIEITCNTLRQEINSDPIGQIPRDNRDVPDGDCQIIYVLDIVPYYSRILRKSLNHAVWDVLGYSLIFLVAVLVGESVRQTRILSASWSLWRQGEFPLWQYLGVGSLATVVCILFYVPLVFGRLVWLPSLSIDMAGMPHTLINDFRAHLKIAILVPLMAFAIAWWICRMKDVYSDSDGAGAGAGAGADADAASWRKLLLYASVAAVINGFVLLHSGVLVTLKSAVNAMLIPGFVVFVLGLTYLRLLKLSDGSTSRRSLS